MAFVKKTWVDREVEYPGRRTITDGEGNITTVLIERADGTVYTQGDAFNATNMNDLETRIYNFGDSTETAIADINSDMDDLELQVTDIDSDMHTTISINDSSSPYSIIFESGIADGSTSATSITVKNGWAFINVSFKLNVALTSGEKVLFSLNPAALSLIGAGYYEFMGKASNTLITGALSTYGTNNKFSVFAASNVSKGAYINLSGAFPITGSTSAS